MVFDTSKFYFCSKTFFNFYFLWNSCCGLTFLVHILLFGILSASYSCSLFLGRYGLLELIFMYLRKYKSLQKMVIVKFVFYSVNYDALND
jgi:hypothetical protein